MSEKVTFFSTRSPVDAKLTVAINEFPLSLLLLLLLLLARVQHASSSQCDRFLEHLDVTDVIGQHQYQRRIEIGALGIAKASMRLDDGAEGVVGFCKVRAGRERHRKNLS